MEAAFLQTMAFGNEAELDHTSYDAFLETLPFGNEAQLIVTASNAVLHTLPFGDASELDHTSADPFLLTPPFGNADAGLQPRMASDALVQDATLSGPCNAMGSSLYDTSHADAQTRITGTTPSAPSPAEVHAAGSPLFGEGRAEVDPEGTGSGTAERGASWACGEGVSGHVWDGDDQGSGGGGGENVCVPPAKGDKAMGETSAGRMAEPHTGPVRSQETGAMLGLRFTNPDVETAFLQSLAKKCCKVCMTF
jgi:hypothetical protein